MFAFKTTSIGGRFFPPNKKNGGVHTASVMQVAISTLISVFVIIIYTMVIASLNTATLPAAGVTLIAVIPLVLIASVVIGVLVSGFGRGA